MAPVLAGQGSGVEAPTTPICEVLEFQVEGSEEEGEEEEGSAVAALGPAAPTGVVTARKGMRESTLKVSVSVCVWGQGPSL